jgi:hypothetical protein
MMIAGAVVLPAGVAWTTATAFMTLHCDYEGPLKCDLKNQATFLVPLGVGMMVVGTILLSVGVGYRVRYNRWKRWMPAQTTAFAPALLRNGVGLTYAARF